MPEAIRFLHCVSHALAAMSLYPEGHASREGALDTAFQALLDLLNVADHPEFSFLGNEVVLDEIPIREMRDWDWSRRLAAVGIERMEFDTTATREDLESFIDDIITRFAAHGIDSSEARQMRPSGIRYGAIAVGEEESRGADVATAFLDVALAEEARTTSWLHEELRAGRALQLAEADALVRALSVAMHNDQHLIVPLLQMRNYDEYTTTHSLNVCVLAMALAEWLEFGARDVMALGSAGLLHDLGKVKIPVDLLNKPGKLTDSERAVFQGHPEEGARLILAAERRLDLAAVVAYEHHILINRAGYPSFKYARDCHYASKLVHVCDVYDALRTNRPYRDAWSPSRALAYIEARAGTEFDGDIAHAFTHMMAAWEPNVVSLDMEEASQEESQEEQEEATRELG